MDTEGTLTKLFQSVLNYASALIPPALTFVLHTIMSQKVGAFPLLFFTLLARGLYGSVNGQTK